MRHLFQILALCSLAACAPMQSVTSGAAEPRLQSAALPTESQPKFNNSVVRRGGFEYAADWTGERFAGEYGPPFGCKSNPNPDQVGVVVDAFTGLTISRIMPTGEKGQYIVTATLHDGPGRDGRRDIQLNGTTNNWVLRDSESGGEIKYLLRLVSPPNASRTGGHVVVDIMLGDRYLSYCFQPTQLAKDLNPHARPPSS